MNAKHIEQAERELVEALLLERNHRELLNALAVLYLRSGRLGEAASVLWRAIDVAPDEVGTYHTLADVLTRLGRPKERLDLYQRLVMRRPDDALAQFNLACCLRAEGNLEEALAAHERAIALGIDQPEEVWTNIGVILGELHRDAPARQAFEKALVLSPTWIPALYNLALWHEEHGDRSAAKRLFEQILSRDPGYHEALVRLAQLQKVDDPHAPIIVRLQGALASSDLVPLARESLHFALGKAFDECASYEEAFEHYRRANEHARTRSAAYSHAAAEQQFLAIREAFSADWVRRCPSVADAAPIFICGMFRSGTTLLAQMLAGHRTVTDGGEIGWFHGRIPWRDAAWPAKMVQVSGATLQNFGKGYLEYLAHTFPGAPSVVDQRPDNFLLIGLLHALYPKARFLHMVRDARDTALSIYFQQFGDALGHVNDLGDVAHYLAQYRTLMQHWRALPATSGPFLLDVHYEALVADPRRQLLRICEFLGLEWDDDLLKFNEREVRVRTASVWQVREPLYESSVGRWRNYAAHLGALGALETGGTST